MTRWYVVNTKLRQEMAAQRHLENQGFSTWLPCFRKTRRHARRVDTVLTPLFPGYLFTQLDITDENWNSVNGTWGVHRLLESGGTPVALPEDFIQNLRSREDGSGAVMLADAGMEPGQKLRILDGPFEDSIGTLQYLKGNDRVAVLLSIFNKEVSTTVSKEMVAAL